MPNNAPKIQVREKPNGIIKLSKKGLGLAFGIMTLFFVVLAYGISQQKMDINDSSDELGLMSALDSDLSNKINSMPNMMIAKSEKEILPPPGDTIIQNFHEAEKPVSTKIPPPKVEKIDSLSMKDILAQRRFAALEQAVISNSNATTSANTPVETNGLNLRGGNGSNGNIDPSAIQQLLAQNAEQDQNKQPRKEDFLKTANKDYANGYLASTRQHPISPYEVKQGTVIPAVMVGGLNSDLPGYIKAMVTEDVYDTATGDWLLIPKGSQLIGVYDSRVAYGQERALVVWRRVVFPDASALDLENMPGMDEGGFSGMFDRVDNHYGKVFGAGIVLSLFQATYDITANNNRGDQPNDGDTAAEAISKQMSQIGMEYARRGLNIQPTIEIRNGVQFNVFVHKDIAFNEAYEDRFINVAEYEMNKIR